VHPVNTPRIGKGRRRYLSRKNEASFIYHTGFQEARLDTYYRNDKDKNYLAVQLPPLKSNYREAYSRSVSRMRPQPTSSISPARSPHVSRADVSLQNEAPQDFRKYLQKPEDLLKLSYHPAFQQPVYSKSNPKFSIINPITGVARDSRADLVTSRLSEYPRTRSISPI